MIRVRTLWSVVVMELMQWAGVLLSIYGLHGVATGRIHAKDGISMRTIYKSEEPFQFWVVCACYLFVGILIYVAIGHRFG
jgi:hypothetical protein